jgi:hypothetical protein
MKSSIFWDIMLYSPLKVNQHFSETWYIMLYSPLKVNQHFSETWDIMLYSPLKVNQHFSETSSDFLGTRQHYVPEDRTLNKCHP